MVRKRCVIVYGQFGSLADPVNLNALATRLHVEGFEVIIIQHTDSQSAYDYLYGVNCFRSLIGSSLGAMSVVVFAGYMLHKPIHFVGGFQPSDYDPSGHNVNIVETDPDDVITRAIEIPANVQNALCFRNPVVAQTGGLGHAAYVLSPSNKTTKLVTYKREDFHPGDFGEAQDIMFNKAKELANA